MNKKQNFMLKSLKGLAIGDAFGECYFREDARQLIASRQLIPGRWRWTDDTAMAISIVEVLFSEEQISRDLLAQHFARRFVKEPWRGYGGGAKEMLARIAKGGQWQQEASALFDGGSWGNGGAMRAAPIGAYYFEDPQRAVAEAQKSAEVTHAHIEGQVGAMAVAAAAALKTHSKSLAGTEFLSQVLKYLPDSKTAVGIENALSTPPGDVEQAAQILGNGSQVAAFDTVPFCLWIVAFKAPDFESAMWATVSALGDQDTTCAIVGGILGTHFALPQSWKSHCEPLPEIHWDLN